jgi:hypothetical protein
MMTTITWLRLVHQKDRDLSSLRGCVLYMRDAKIGLVNYLRCEVFGVTFFSNSNVMISDLPYAAEAIRGQSGSALSPLCA